MCPFLNISLLTFSLDTLTRATKADKRMGHPNWPVTTWIRSISRQVPRRVRALPSLTRDSDSFPSLSLAVLLDHINYNICPHRGRRLHSARQRPVSWQHCSTAWRWSTIAMRVGGEDWRGRWIAEGGWRNCAFKWRTACRGCEWLPGQDPTLRWVWLVEVVVNFPSTCRLLNSSMYDCGGWCDARNHAFPLHGHWGDIVRLTRLMGGEFRTFWLSKCEKEWVIIN